MQPYKSTSKMHGYKMKVLRGWKKTKSDLFGIIFTKYQRCVIHLKRCVLPTPRANNAKRLSRTKLHPLPDKPIRRAASKLSRKPTNELERMRRKGSNWTANDLFRFQYGCFDGIDPDELREICEEWLNRLYAIPKKYCYLAWYASAIYSCFYRIAPLVSDADDRKDLWMDVKREYAEIFQMGRRIWRRPTHPSRLRVVYDMAMLCIRFNDIPNDPTIVLFRDLLADRNNFDFSVLDEIEYAQSIDKTVRLENHVIDLFFERRKSMVSTRSSIRSKASNDTPRSSFRARRTRNDSEQSNGSPNSPHNRIESKGSRDRSETCTPKTSFRSRKDSVSPRGRGDTLSPKTSFRARKESPYSKTEPSSPRGVPKEKSDRDCKGNERKTSSGNGFPVRKESKDASAKRNTVTRKISCDEKEPKESGLTYKSSFRKKADIAESGARNLDDAKHSITSPPPLLLVVDESETTVPPSAHSPSSPISPRSVHFASDELHVLANENPNSAATATAIGDDNKNCVNMSGAIAASMECNEFTETVDYDGAFIRRRSTSASASEIINIIVTKHQEETKI